jgi:hypothetical protein
VSGTNVRDTGVGAVEVRVHRGDQIARELCESEPAGSASEDYSIANATVPDKGTE